VLIIKQHQLQAAVLNLDYDGLLNNEYEDIQGLEINLSKMMQAGSAAGLILIIHLRKKV
jgi:hypothetical protein